MAKSKETKFVLPKINLERLMREVNILLISDLHYDIGKSPPKDSPCADDINTSLVETLSELEKDDWEPDIVIVAGDLVNHGKKANYGSYFDLISKLTIRFPNLKDAVFSTPGNHDIDRQNVAAIFRYLYLLKKEDAANASLPSYTKNDVVDTLFSTSHYDHKSKLKTKLIKYLGAFEKEYFKTFLEQDEVIQDGIRVNKIDKTYPVNGLKTVYTKDILGVTLLSINSSFFCNVSNSPSDRNNLFYVKDVITKTLKSLNRSFPIVTFMHHPFYYMHESEFIYPLETDSTSRYNNFNKIADKSELILSGHVHGELHKPSIIHQKTYCITNGTTYTNDDWGSKCYPYTFAVVKVNKQLNKFALRGFRFDNDEKKFVRQPAGVDKKVKDTFYDFQKGKSIRENSTELEKVNIIRYLLTVIGDKTVVSPTALEKALISLQLAVYIKTEIVDISDADVKKEYGNVFGKIQHHAFETLGKKIIVVKIEQVEFQEIFDLFMDKLKDKTGCTIFFAINIEKALHPIETITVKELEKFINRLQSTILSAKVEVCRLDFLYY